MEKNVSKSQMSDLPYTIAVDFDGTLVEDKFPLIGEPIESTWIELRKAIDEGAKVILWTSRDNEKLMNAVLFCAERGLHFDAINDNLDEVKILFNNNTRKVFANEYWDDRAVPKYCRAYPYPDEYTKMMAEVKK